MKLKEANEYITGEVIKALEHGEIPWHKPWRCLDTDIPDPRTMPVSYSTGRCYSMSNQWLIMLSGHGAGEYATFQQIRALGGKVKRGEHGVGVFFFKSLAPVPLHDNAGNELVDETGRVRQFVPWVARVFTVFNTYTQCEGIAPRWKHRVENAERELLAQSGHTATPIESAEALASGYTEREGVTIQHGGDRACYSPFEDAIHMPLREVFDAMPEYYKALFHEMAHSTGSGKRLNRQIGGMFGSYEYGREELVAEISAAVLMHHLKLPVNITNTAAYIQNWLQACRKDPGAILYASKQAMRATALIAGISEAGEAASDGETDNAA